MAKRKWSEARSESSSSAATKEKAEEVDAKSGAIFPESTPGPEAIYVGSDGKRVSAAVGSRWKSSSSVSFKGKTSLPNSWKSGAQSIFPYVKGSKDGKIKWKCLTCGSKYLVDDTCKCSITTCRAAMPFLAKLLVTYKGRWPCAKCGKLNMPFHIRCNCCGATMPSKPSDLKSNIEASDGGRSPKETTPIFPCHDRKCDSEFRDEADRHKHYIEAHQNKTHSLPCDAKSCKLSFKSSEARSEHYRFAHVVCEENLDFLDGDALDIFPLEQYWGPMEEDLVPKPVPNPSLNPNPSPNPKQQNTHIYFNGKKKK